MGIIFYVFFVILSACGQTKPAKQTKPISNSMENFEQTDSFWKAKLSDVLLVEMNFFHQI